MKTMYSLFVTICLLYLVSGCTSDDLVCTSEMGNRKLTATIEGQDAVTRVKVGADGEVTWAEGDEIGVFSSKSQNVSFALFDMTDSGKSATFMGDIPSEEQIDFTYYPYKEDVSIKGKSLRMELPSEYSYTGNSQAPMVGVRLSSGNFSFYHVCGLLRIELDDIPDGAERFLITSEGENAPGLAGLVEIDDITASDTELHLLSHNKKSVTYNFSKAIGGLTFFVPIPIGKYPQLSVSLQKADGTVFFTRTLSNQVFKRGVMVDLPILNGYTGDCFVLSEAVRRVKRELEDKVTVSATNASQLIYSNVSEEEVPQVGNIVIAPTTKNLPDGFLGKVTAVQKGQNASYIVNTESTALSEAFDELYVNETINLMPMESSQTRGLLHTMGTIFKDWDITREQEFEFEQGDKFQCGLNGKIGIGGELIVNMQFDKKEKLEYGAFTFVFKVRLAANSIMSYKVEHEIKEILRQRIFQLRLPNIHLAGGFVQIVPVLVGSAVVRAKGEVAATFGMATEFQFTAGALYKDGKWSANMRSDLNKANAESPFNFSSDLILKGEMFVGLEGMLDLRLYNLDNMKIGIGLATGPKASAEVALDLSKPTAEEVLNSTKINLSLGLDIQAKADATIMGDDVKADLTFPFKFKETTISLFPKFSNLQVNTSSGGGKYLSSDVKTEVSGELMMKDAKVALALVDENEEIVKMSEPISYTGSKTFDEELDVILPMENEFDKLNSTSVYKACPVVVSPQFEKIAKDGKLLLLNQAVDVGMAVDLGLSVKWAAWNVGASAPEEPGGLYGWGDSTGTNTTTDVWYWDYENEPFENQRWISPLYGGPYPPANICGTDLDIAHVQWGGTWRLPTREEHRELTMDCKWEFITNNGSKGVRITGPNGNSI